jgi:hypothetical protein
MANNRAQVGAAGDRTLFFNADRPRSRLANGGAERNERGRKTRKAGQRMWELRVARQSGMFPCLRFGPGSRFVSSVCSAVMTFGRVSWGTITSSM